MRKILNTTTLYLFIFLLAIVHHASGQQAFHVFKYNDYYGLVNNSGDKIIEGDFIEYEDYNNVPNHALFETKAEKMVLINLQTGKQEIFDSYDPNCFYSEDEYFALAEKNKTYYYIGQKSGTILPIPKQLKNSYNPKLDLINKKYLCAIASETVYKTPKKVVTKSNSPIKPVEPAPYPVEEKYVYIFQNKKSLPFIKKIKLEDKFYSSNSAKDIFEFYNVKHLPKKDSLEKTEMIIPTVSKSYNENLMPWHFYYDAEFNYASLAVGKDLLICDSLFKVIKIVPLQDQTKRDAVEAYFKKTYPQDDILVDYAEFSAPVSVGMMGTRRKDFWTQSTTDGKTLLSYLKNDEYLPYMSTNSTILNLTEEIITLQDNQGNKLTILSEYKKPMLHIPKKYIAQFDIKQL